MCAVESMKHSSIVCWSETSCQHCDSLKHISEVLFDFEKGKVSLLDMFFHAIANLIIDEVSMCESQFLNVSFSHSFQSLLHPYKSLMPLNDLQKLNNICSCVCILFEVVYLIVQHCSVL